VSSRFIGGVCTGVAHGTGVGGLSMIKRQYEVYPSRSGGMTQLTSISGNRVGSRFIRSIGARVTTRAAIASLIVRKWHDRRYPYIRGMASFTQFRSLGMRRGLIRSGTNPVVTASAIACLTRHRAVIKYNL